MVEYYEGFLMAVDSLKRTGISLDLYVYDCGKEVSTLNTILAKNEMKSMNIIFGPMHQNQIKPLSDFAEKNDIRLVIPFSKRRRGIQQPSCLSDQYASILLIFRSLRALHPSIPQCKRYLHRTGER